MRSYIFHDFIRFKLQLHSDIFYLFSNLNRIVASDFDYIMEAEKPLVLLYTTIIKIAKYLL